MPEPKEPGQNQENKGSSDYEKALMGTTVSDRANAKGYVAVEPVFSSELLTGLVDTLNPDIDSGVSWSSSVEPKHALNKIPVAIVEEDMLSFLKRLPDNSVSVLNAGIDKIVMPDLRYRNSVAKEIIRVLNPQGGYVGQRFMHIKLPESNDIEQTTVGSSDEKDHPYRAAIIYRKTDSNT